MASKKRVIELTKALQALMKKKRMNPRQLFTFYAKGDGRLSRKELKVMLDDAGFYFTSKWASGVLEAVEALPNDEGFEKDEYKDAISWPEYLRLTRPNDQTSSIGFKVERMLRVG